MHERRKYSPYGYKRIGGTWIPLDGAGNGVMEATAAGHREPGKRPGCAGCNIASHGFICQLGNNSCLRCGQGGSNNTHATDDPLLLDGPP